MTQFETLVELLRERLTKTNITNPKANRAHVTLKGVKNWDTKLEEWVVKTFDYIVYKLERDHLGEPVGETKLTATSAALGRNILRNIQENPPTPLCLQVGDALVGLFVSLDYIKIDRDMAGHAGSPVSQQFASEREPYLIWATDKLEELGAEINDSIRGDLEGISEEPIPQLTQLLQNNGRSVLKFPTEEQEAAANLSIKEDDLWVQAADNIQGTGWKINKEVAEIFLRDFDDLLVEVPPKPLHGDKKKLQEAFEALKKKDNDYNRKRYNKAAAEWNDMLGYLAACSKNAARRVIRSKVSKALELDQFYFYVDFDTRGRLYYQSYGLDFQGSDLARGVLSFSEGKKITEEGRYWLAIHTANSANFKFSKGSIPEYFEYDYDSYLEESGLQDISLDKMTLKDRVNWVENNLELLVNSAEAIDHSADKPISYLACCVEWKNYLENPEEHLSYLPVSIDGSNNGYQHSAAIARDPVTAKYVGMTSTEIPQDLYMVCAKELIKRCPEFFSKRDMSMSQIRKAIAKRGTMTRAYSAGVATMAENMYADCHKEGYTTKFNITMFDCLTLSKNLYELIKDVCPGACKTMDFLQQLVEYELGNFEYFKISDGSKVTKSARKKLMVERKKLMKLSPDEMDSEQLERLDELSAMLLDIETRCTWGNGQNVVSWTTPSGFPATSDYKIQSTYKVLSTVVGFKGGAKAQPGRIKHVLQTDTQCPDRTKYISSISPNFIHSLDSSHMLATIVAWGGSFGAIHDSFSVHASDVPVLVDLTKETFHEMYDVEDPYASIVEMILTDATEYDEDVPHHGSYELSQVKTSDYFFC